MALRFLATEKAPAAIGPYSQGVKAENIIYTSGQLPIDSTTGELCTNDIRKATTLCLNNVKVILESAHATVEDIVKVTVFVTDMADFATINEAYTEFFKDHKPARSLVQVAALPKAATIEIEAVAII